MKRFCLLLSCLFFYTINHAQVRAFKPLRYDEDYVYLSKDTSNDWYKKMKYKRLSKNADHYLSFGGETRFQYFNLKNQDWGDAPGDKDGYVLTRFLFHGDWHAGKHFRVFAQLQSSMINGATSSSPVEQNELELHQAFADYSTDLAGGKWTLRAGRHELSYGSQRLISVRELPNNRQSFDGIRSFWKNDRSQIDLLYTHYVAAKKGIFNDGFNKDVQLWGTYFTRNKIPFIQNADLYYFGVRKKQTAFDDGSGRELRHSIGARIFSGKQDLQYDLEGVYQWGSFGQNEIDAWTASANVFYTFSSASLKPVIGFKTELISGDKQYNDGKLNTFNPLFPRGAYFGLAALIGPANLIDIHPYTELALTKDLSWQTDYDIFWRQSIHDGIYGPNVMLIYPGGNANAKHIGQQLGTAVIYTPNQFLYLRGEFTWFNTGGYIKQSGAGRDIVMGGATVQLKF